MTKILTDKEYAEEKAKEEKVLDELRNSIEKNPDYYKIDDKLKPKSNKEYSEMMKKKMQESGNFKKVK